MEFEFDETVVVPSNNWFSGGPPLDRWPVLLRFQTAKDTNRFQFLHETVV